MPARLGSLATLDVGERIAEELDRAAPADEIREALVEPRLSLWELCRMRDLVDHCLDQADAVFA